MSKLWVVELYYKDKTWSIASVSEDIQFADSNFYEAHKLKQAIQQYLSECHVWWTYPKHFRVRKYVPEEEK